VVPQIWFTEPEYGSVQGHLGRKQSQEDLNVTPTYLTQTCNVTLKRCSWIEFKDLSSHLLSEQATMTHKVWLLLPILSLKCTMVTIGATQEPYICSQRIRPDIHTYITPLKSEDNGTTFLSNVHRFPKTAVLYLKVSRLRPLVPLVMVTRRCS
jgi:hypothetical protein